MARQKNEQPRRNYKIGNPLWLIRIILYEFYPDIRCCLAPLGFLGHIRLVSQCCYPVFLCFDTFCENLRTSTFFFQVGFQQLPEDNEKRTKGTKQ